MMKSQSVGLGEEPRSVGPQFLVTCLRTKVGASAPCNAFKEAPCLGDPSAIPQTSRDPSSAPDSLGGGARGEVGSLLCFPKTLLTLFVSRGKIFICPHNHICCQGQRKTMVELFPKPKLTRLVFLHIFSTWKFETRTEISLFPTIQQHETTSSFPLLTDLALT